VQVLQSLLLHDQSLLLLQGIVLDYPVWMRFQQLWFSYALE
jgi:hypothetical protein